MKKLLLSVFAIAAMASCMQDEVISQDQQAIDFGTPFVDKATKAEDLTYNASNLNEFFVYGTVTGTAGTVNIFNNTRVYGDKLVGTNTVWGCDVKQYWIPGASYVFDAVVFAIMLIFVFLSAFFSMSETAFSSSSVVKLKSLVEDRKPGAKKALELADNFDKTVTTLLIGNNIVNTYATKTEVNNAIAAAVTKALTTSV